MKNKKLIVAFAFFCFSFHVVMVVNLGQHFQFARYFPPTFQPVKTGTSHPNHWNAVKGQLKQGELNIFEKKQQEVHQKEINAKGLIAIPQRATDNFGLDFFFRDANHCDPGGDYFQFYQGGYNARYGVSIFENYRENVSGKLIKKIKSITPLHPPNRYPPGFIYSLGVFLSLFSIWNAYVIWVLIHEIVLLFCVYLTWKLVRPDIYRFLFLSSLWMGFSPWYLELYMGQANFIVMAGTFVLGVYLLRGAGSIGTAFAWIVTLTTKPLTLLFTPLFLMLKRYRLVFSVITIAFLINLPYFIFRPEDGILFVKWAFGQKMVHNPGNYCFQNFLFHFHFSEFIVKIISYLLLMFGCIMTVLTGRRYPLSNLVLWISIYMLSYAHVWQHHQVILLPAIILMMIKSGRYKYLIPWFIMTFPSLFYAFEGHFDWFKTVIYLAIGSFPPLIIAIFVVMDILKMTLKEVS